jgi:DeoR/GlpR family transcriptional regulator of sugar metabolism
VEQLLPAERYRRIQELLRERQVVRVSTLSELLGVSEVTIRRDLEHLERRGLLERTHGGAVLVQRMRTEPGYLDAIVSHPEEKRAIGRAAAALVEPGDTVFLNGGTTTLEVFRHLATPGIRVVTNHVGMALEAGDRDLELILVGGQFRAPSSSVVGPLATEALRRVHADKAFIGVEGVSLRSGLTTPSPQEAEIARLMMERTTGQVTVVADHSKLGTVADFVIAPLEDIDRIVVDGGIEDEYREQLAATDVEVVVAGEPVQAAQGGDG